MARKSEEEGQELRGEGMPRGSGNKTNPGRRRKKLSPRAKVKKAQMSVLGKMNKILAGNCKSASEGNYKCAEFVLDWSGITEIRTPLAKPKRKSLVAGLPRQAESRKKADEQDGDE